MPAAPGADQTAEGEKEPVDPDNPYIKVGGHPRAPLRVGGFGSEHVGGAVFAYADGSVQVISESISKEPFQALANRNDGKVMGDRPW